MNANVSVSGRRYDLDWLRVLAILTVFVYHTTRFFNLGDWHVKNPVNYVGVDVLERFVEIWMMPLIFVISGASLFYALDKGGAGKFIKDKALRLLVPLVVGVFTFSILQVYLERITHGQFFGTFFDFLPHYFEGVYKDQNPASGNFAYAGMHLWYLLILFVYSVACYPLLHWLKGAGLGAFGWLGDFLARPGAVYLLALPVPLLDAIISDTPLGEISSGGWDILLYLPFFLAGFVLVSNARLQARIQATPWQSLVIAILSCAAVLPLKFGLAPATLVPLGELIDDPLASLSALSFILACMGFAMRRLNFTSPALKYANEAVLPFYILHQTVLLSVGYFVVQWDIPDLAKWLVIFVGSFAVIMGLYEYLIRRNKLLRFLFGMKPIKATAQPVAQPVQAISPSSAGSDGFSRSG